MDTSHHHTSTRRQGDEYLQNPQVFESGEITLSDACEVISIQFPAKQTHIYMLRINDQFILMDKAGCYKCKDLSRSSLSRV